MTWTERQVKPNGPSAEPRARTSPTAFETMRACMYRSGFEHDQVYRQDLFPSPQIVIGNAAHKLKEVGTRGDLAGLAGADLRNEASKLWDEEVALGHGEMVARALGDPPMPAAWPGYQLSRMSAIKDLEASPVETFFHGASASADPEVQLTAHDGAITGRVDLVRVTADGVEIVDYKTGDLFERESQGDGEPPLKAAYRRQLLLYAYLYHEGSGAWPTRVTVQKADGSQSVSFRPDPAEAESLAAEALGLLKRFNRDAKAGALQASPSQDACRACPFKAACPSFFDAAGEEWDLGGRHCVRGKVASMTPGTGLVVLEGAVGNVEPIQAHVLRVPRAFFEHHAVGDTVSFSDLEGGPGKGLGFLWWSRSWGWGWST